MSRTVSSHLKRGASSAVFDAPHEVRGGVAGERSCVVAADPAREQIAKEVVDDAGEADEAESLAGVAQFAPAPVAVAGGADERRQSRIESLGRDGGQARPKVRFTR